MFGHDYEIDEHKSQYYPSGYKVEKCQNCEDLTLTLMYDDMEQFQKTYGESPFETLQGK